MSQHSPMPIPERLSLQVKDATAYSSLGRSNLYILMSTGKLASAQIEAAALEKELGENIEVVLVGWLPAAG